MGLALVLLAVLSFALVALVFYALTPAKNGKREAFFSHISNNFVRILMLSALVLFALSMIFSIVFPGTSGSLTSEAGAIAGWLIGSKPKSPWEGIVFVLGILLMALVAWRIRGRYGSGSKKPAK